MITVVIPTYKHPGRLLKNLTHNLPYLTGLHIIIVNDFPGDKDILLQSLKDLPVTLLHTPVNKGFAGAINTGIQTATTQYTMLLNDDVLLNDDSYKKALHLFAEHSNLFAVSFAQEEKDGGIVGHNEVYWSNGFVNHRGLPILDYVSENGWAEGGAALFDTKKLHELGAFDERYNPFYWEDVDLSYRAKKQGWKVLFDPHILVEHHHESTIASTNSRRTIDTIAFRNQLLFIWTNITDTTFRREHRIALYKHIVKTLLMGNTLYWDGYKAAKRIAAQKHNKTPHNAINDYDILFPNSK